MSMPELEQPTVAVSTLRKFTEKLAMMNPDTKITLEMVMVALFPYVYTNIEEYAKKCYTAGYLQGKEESEHENKGNK